MNSKLLTTALLLAITSCKEKPASTDTPLTPSINGTWALVSSRIITKGDTLITFPVKGQEMIKIFNDQHFAFFKHDVDQRKRDTAVFDAGAGTYELDGEKYTEHLQYCSYRDWENRDFHFKLKLKGDTLIQTGIEKIDSLGIDQEILEIYVKKK